MIIRSADHLSPHLSSVSWGQDCECLMDSCQCLVTVTMISCSCCPRMKLLTVVLAEHSAWPALSPCQLPRHCTDQLGVAEVPASWLLPSSGPEQRRRRVASLPAVRWRCSPGDQGADLADQEDHLLLLLHLGSQEADHLQPASEGVDSGLVAAVAANNVEVRLIISNSFYSVMAVYES